MFRESSIYEQNVYLTKLAMEFCRALSGGAFEVPHVEIGRGAEPAQLLSCKLTDVANSEYLHDLGRCFLDPSGEEKTFWQHLIDGRVPQFARVPFVDLFTGKEKSALVPITGFMEYLAVLRSMDNKIESNTFRWRVIKDNNGIPKALKCAIGKAKGPSRYGQVSFLLSSFNTLLLNCRLADKKDIQCYKERIIWKDLTLSDRVSYLAKLQECYDFFQRPMKVKSVLYQDIDFSGLSQTQQAKCLQQVKKHCEFSDRTGAEAVYKPTDYFGRRPEPAFAVEYFYLRLIHALPKCREINERDDVYGSLLSKIKELKLKCEAAKLLGLKNLLKKAPGDVVRQIAISYLGPVLSADVASAAISATGSSGIFAGNSASGSAAANNSLGGGGGGK